MGDAGAYVVSRLVTREMGMRLRPFKGEKKKILISTKSGENPDSPHISSQFLHRRHKRI
ncbi:hypothetical protein ECDEC6B_5440 [Escherichia coli DEC6B]|nr:hypothetical protein ECDEC6B_5440 [Escherichia coli DEC6B]